MDPKKTGSHEAETDKGYGRSHGYGPGHGGPSGPGDVPGDRTKERPVTPATGRDRRRDAEPPVEPVDPDDETTRPSEKGPWQK